jgi:hypothetical protein
MAGRESMGSETNPGSPAQPPLDRSNSGPRTLKCLRKWYKAMTPLDDAAAA